MKRWLVFLGLADEETTSKRHVMGIFGSILIVLAPVTVFAGKLSLNSILVGAASIVVGAGIVLYSRSLKQT